MGGNGKVSDGGSGVTCFRSRNFLVSFKLFRCVFSITSLAVWEALPACKGALLRPFYEFFKKNG